MLLLKSFIEELSDPRSAKGSRHSFENLMTIILLAHCLGYVGYRGVHRFAKNNAEFLELELDMPFGIPAHNTFRRLLQKLNAHDVVDAFNKWAARHFEIPWGSALSVDGQALGSTVTQAGNAEQNFVAVVSLFAQTTGLTHALATYQSKKASEIHVVAELLGANLPQNSEILQQADALHSKKNAPDNFRNPI